MPLNLLNWVETGYCEDLPPGPDGLKKLAWIERLERAKEGIDPFPTVDKIEVHELYDDVDDFVELFRDNRDKSMLNRRLQVRLQPIPHEHPQPANHTRFVCISDTHGYHRDMKHKLPPGDVLLHCGDFTDLGKEEEVEDFNEWLGELDYKYKIVICGNHEVSFDQEMVEKARESKEKELWYRFEFIAKNPKEKTDNWAKVMTNCVLLQDAEISVNGIRIYGTPWNPYFGGWAFNLERGQPLLDKWNKIPAGVDILMTHCPPAGQLDIVKHPDRKDKRVGCVELMNTVQLRVKPKYHVFGHIHESHGFNTDAWHHFINCTILNKDQLPYNKAVIIDFPNKPNFKEGLSEVTQY